MKSIEGVLSTGLKEATKKTKQELIEEELQKQALKLEKRRKEKYNDRWQEKRKKAIKLAKKQRKINAKNR